MTASQPRTGRTWTSWPSARASVRVQAPAHSRIVAASNVPSSVATRPRVTRFTSTCGAHGRTGCAGGRRRGRGQRARVGAEPVGVEQAAGDVRGQRRLLAQHLVVIQQHAPVRGPPGAPPAAHRSSPASACRSAPRRARSRSPSRPPAGGRAGSSRRTPASARRGRAAAAGPGCGRLRRRPARPARAASPGRPARRAARQRRRRRCRRRSRSRPPSGGIYSPAALRPILKDVWRPCFPSQDSDSRSGGRWSG